MVACSLFLALGPVGSPLGARNDFIRPTCFAIRIKMKRPVLDAPLLADAGLDG